MENKRAYEKWLDRGDDSGLDEIVLDGDLD